VAPRGLGEVWRPGAAVASRGRGRRGPDRPAQMLGRGLSRGADSGGHCRKVKRRSRNRKSPRGAPRGALPSHGRTMSRLASATHSSDPPRRSAVPRSGWRTTRSGRKEPADNNAAGTKKTALFDMVKMETMRTGRADEAKSVQCRPARPPRIPPRGMAREGRRVRRRRTALALAATRSCPRRARD
jgi:hypothetical protein